MRFLSDLWEVIRTNALSVIWWTLVGVAALVILLIVVGGSTH